MQHMEWVWYSPAHKVGVSLLTRWVCFAIHVWYAATFDFISHYVHLYIYFVLTIIVNNLYCTTKWYHTTKWYTTKWYHITLCYRSTLRYRTTMTWCCNSIHNMVPYHSIVSYHHMVPNHPTVPYHAYTYSVI